MGDTAASTEHTVVDIQSLFREAEREVEDSGVATEFRPGAFSAAVQLLASGHRLDATQESENGHTAEASGSSAPRAVDLGALADRLGVSRDAVESVYTEVDGGIQISVDPRKLSKSKSAGARELAYLVAVPRQAAGEDQTHVEEFRKAAIEYDKFDAPNFAAAMADLKGSFVLKGPARQRTFKLTKPGWTAAGDLIRHMGEGG